MSQFLDRLIDPELRAHPEFQSGLARSAIWVFALIYILGGRAAGFFHVDLDVIAALFGVYLVVFVAVLIHVARDRALRRWRRYLTMVLDISASTLAIWFTGAANGPFFLLYIWIFVSYGTRYGREYLIAASLGSLFAYSIVVFALSEDPDTLYETAFLLVSLIALPMYELSLLKKLHRARQRAEAAAEAKANFLATMTHEFRTPLTGVLGMMQLLENTPLNAEQREYAGSVIASAEMLRALIGDILDFSKIDADKVELEHTPYDLEATLHSVCRELSTQTYEKGLELTLSVDTALPAGVIGDRLRLQQVLYNLIGNAIKFTEQGEVNVIARQETDEDGVPLLMLQVADTGIGIAKESLPHVFDSFWQEDSSTTRRYGGTGLGTTIARDLVRLMGGDIQVARNEPEGTVFTVHLPLMPEAPARLINRVARVQGLRKVLLMETNATSRENLLQYCLDLGVDVHLIQLSALSGNLAEVLDCEADAAIVCDAITDLDIYALAERLDRHCEGRLPIVAVSYARRRRFEVEQSGVHVLTKPVSVVALAEALSQIAAERERLTDESEDQEESENRCAGRRILVAEDDRISARLLNTLLSQRGCEVVVAENGQVALDLTREQTFDLAFVDIRMPVMDGLEFVRRFRAGEGDARRMPIIALTVDSASETRQACLDVGMDRFMTKPLDSDLLSRTLAEYIR